MRPDKLKSGSMTKAHLLSLQMNKLIQALVRLLHRVIEQQKHLTAISGSQHYISLPRLLKVGVHLIFLIILKVIITVAAKEKVQEANLLQLIPFLQTANLSKNTILQRTSGM